MRGTTRSQLGRGQPGVDQLFILLNIFEGLWEFTKHADWLSRLREDMPWDVLRRLDLGLVAGCSVLAQL